MDTVNTQMIDQIRKELENFEFIHCGMAHEKIQRESDGISPLHDCAADHGLKRVTYCNAQVRSRRMGCAHTTARIKFLEILDKVPKTGLSSEKVEAWKQQVSDLDFAIIQVDQRKSDSELQHAQKSIELCDSPTKQAEISADLHKLNKVIDNQINEHGNYLNQLKSLRDEVLEFLASAELNNPT